MGTSADRAIRRFDVIDSTNREAVQWARDGAEPGSVVVADQQTAGRGRLDRTWFSPKGEGLFFSVILEPPGPPDTFTTAGLAAAVALHTTLAGRGVETLVKWPNDIIIGDRKVAGILSELASLPDGRTPVVVGIGLNVGMSSFPAELEDVATSLLISTGTLFHRDELLEQILSELDRTMFSSSASVIDRYRAICSTLGRDVRIETPSGSVTGIASAIDERGGLVLEDGSVFLAGDVIHLR